MCGKACKTFVKFYEDLVKYPVSDSLKTAFKKHTKDKFVLQSAFSDLKNFYDTLVLSPPPRKPTGKPTIENLARYLETYLEEKLKDTIFTCLDGLNRKAKK